jgi:aspartate kinase
MIVAKFGGAVLHGPDGIRRACVEIRSLPRPLLVVVSAFADITNRLEQLADTATRDGAPALGALASIVELHRDVARQVLSDAAMERWENRVAGYAARLDEIVRGLAIVRELTPRTLDLVVHFGELYSSSILLAALEDDGADAIGISALDLVITDQTHRYARPVPELVRDRVRKKLLPALDGDRVVVTEGYIARSASGEVTTMGRESSNFTAAMLGDLLLAEEVRIYTNVPGILTADPRHIESTHTLPRLSYGMARTLAELGAKILHPRTVTPVERSAIPLVITEIGGAGSTICVLGDPAACSIAVLPDAKVIVLETASASSSVDELLKRLASETLVIWHHQFRRTHHIVTSGEYMLHPASVTLDPEPVHVGVVSAVVVSLVRERELSGEDLAAFFTIVGEQAPIALQVSVDGRAVSVALERPAGWRIARAMHRHFVEEAAHPVGIATG